MRVLALLWPGRAGRPPGRVVVRLTFSLGRFAFLLCLAPSGLGLPPSFSLPLPFLVALALCFGCFSRPPAAWLFVRSRLVCVSCLAVGCSLVVSPPPPPPLLCLAVFVAPAWCLGVFFFFRGNGSRHQSRVNKLSCKQILNYKRPNRLPRFHKQDIGVQKLKAPHEVHPDHTTERRYLPSWE